MLSGVKLKGRSYLWQIKEGLSVFAFYMVKKPEKKLKWKSLSVKEEGGVGIYQQTNSAKNFKKQLLLVPKLVIFIAYWQ